MNHLPQLLFAFLFTFACEWLVFSIATRKSPAATVKFIFVINLFTWPLVTFLYGLFPGMLNLIEIGVVLVEAILIKVYWNFSWSKSSAVGFAQNAVSYLLGIVIIRFLF